MKKQKIRLNNDTPGLIGRLQKVTGLWFLISALLLAATPALAQDELTDEDGADDDDATSVFENASTETSGDDADSASDAEAEAETTDAAETAGAEETAKVSADAEVKMGGASQTSLSTDSEESDEGDEAENKLSDKAARFANSIGIRKLTSDEYPTYKTRGVTGGSLWRTFHGLQWPYMQQSGIGVSGNIWIDTGYEQIDRGKSGQPTARYLLQEGRAVLRFTPTYTRNRWFIQGQMELVANKDQTQGQPTVADADDLWVRIGMWERFDLQAGRFEAWELYHLGMGLDLNTQERRGAWDTSGLPLPDIYGVTGTYYRPKGPGNVAAHIYPTDFFRVELLGQLGNDGGTNTGAFRGAGILDFGFLKLKGGGEYKVQKAPLESDEKKVHQRGFGGTAQFVIKDFVDFGGSYGWNIIDVMTNKGEIDQKGSYTAWSAGGFLNARVYKDLVIGGGAHYSFKWDIHKDEDNNVGQYSHLQTFVAIQYLLLDQLYLKLVGAYATGHFAPSFSESPAFDTQMFSGRLRLQYDF